MPVKQRISQEDQAKLAEWKRLRKRLETELEENSRDCKKLLKIINHQIDRIEGPVRWKFKSFYTFLIGSLLTAALIYAGAGAFPITMMAFTTVGAAAFTRTIIRWVNDIRDNGAGQFFNKKFTSFLPYLAAITVLCLGLLGAALPALIVGGSFFVYKLFTAGINPLGSAIKSITGVSKNPGIRFLLHILCLPLHVIRAVFFLIRLPLMPFAWMGSKLVNSLASSRFLEWVDPKYRRPLAIAILMTLAFLTIAMTAPYLAPFIGVNLAAVLTVSQLGMVLLGALALPVYALVALFSPMGPSMLPGLPMVFEALWGMEVGKADMLLSIFGVNAVIGITIMAVVFTIMTVLTIHESPIFDLYKNYKYGEPATVESKIDAAVEKQLEKTAPDPTKSSLQASAGNGGGAVYSSPALSSSSSGKSHSQSAATTPRSAPAAPFSAPPLAPTHLASSATSATPAVAVTPGGMG